jgi:CRP-like cAMP-binding protein
LFRAREVPKGTVILKAGEVSDGLYVVLSGEVEAQSGGGLLARLREGELFGEMSLLTRSPAVANVTAVRRTSLLRLPREDFNTVMMTHPQVLELVAELADKRQRQAEELKAAETIAIDEETMLV